MGKTGLDYEKVSALIKLALVEDIGTGDVTSEAVATATMRGRMRFVTRERAVVAGVGLVEPLFKEISREVVCVPGAADGETVEPGRTIAAVSGPVRALLTGERLTLNFLQRLSGIATLTRSFVEAVAGTGTEIYDTRKTTPGMRVLEKYAVRVGGGRNHRMGLYDQVLIKDNHLKCLAKRGDVEGLGQLVGLIREHLPGMVIEVEVEDLGQLDEAVAAGVDVVLLDNMNARQLAEAVKRGRRGGKGPVLECSGGVTLESVRELGKTGVDRISIGRLTHSAPAVDIAAELEDIREGEEQG